MEKSVKHQKEIKNFLLACRDMTVLSDLPENYNWEDYIDHDRLKSAYKIADITNIEEDAVN